MNPLPWTMKSELFAIHSDVDYTPYKIDIIDKNNDIVRSFYCTDLQAEIEYLNKINKTQENNLSEVDIIESCAKIWLVQEPNGLYLRNRFDWTDNVQLARKFRRRSDAQNCINKLSDNIEAKPVYKEIF